MSGELTIRPAHSEDAAAILAYLRQIGAESDNLTFGPEGLPITEEQESSGLSPQPVSRASVITPARARARSRFAVFIVATSNRGVCLGDFIIPYPPGASAIHADFRPFRAGLGVKRLPEAHGQARLC